MRAEDLEVFLFFEKTKRGRGKRRSSSVAVSRFSLFSLQRQQQNIPTHHQRGLVGHVPELGTEVDDHVGRDGVVAVVGVVFLMMRRRLRSRFFANSGKRRRKNNNWMKRCFLLSLSSLSSQNKNTHAMLDATSDPRIIGADSQGERFFLVLRLLRFFRCCDDEESTAATMLPFASRPEADAPLMMGARRRLAFCFSMFSAVVLVAPLLETELANAEEKVPLEVSDCGAWPLLLLPRRRLWPGGAAAASALFPWPPPPPVAEGGGSAPPLATRRSMRERERGRNELGKARRAREREIGRVKTRKRERVKFRFFFAFRPPKKRGERARERTPP